MLKSMVQLKENRSWCADPDIYGGYQSETPYFISSMYVRFSFATQP
jgi:hypothetical protein